MEFDIAGWEIFDYFAPFLYQQERRPSVPFSKNSSTADLEENSLEICAFIDYLKPISSCSYYVYSAAVIRNRACAILQGLQRPEGHSNHQSLQLDKCHYFNALHYVVCTSGNLTAMSPDWVMYLTQGRDGYCN
jgi:hypothetical protein